MSEEDIINDLQEQMLESKIGEEVDGLLSDNLKSSMYGGASPLGGGASPLGGGAEAGGAASPLGGGPEAGGGAGFLSEEIFKKTNELNRLIKE